MREECPSLEREQQIPMHHWRWPKEAFPFLLPHGRERGDGKNFPGAVREGERCREGAWRHNEEERGERSRARL